MRPRACRWYYLAVAPLLSFLAGCAGGTDSSIPASTAPTVPMFARPSTWTGCLERLAANRTMRYTLRIVRFDGNDVDSILNVKPYRTANVVFGPAYVLPRGPVEWDPLAPSVARNPLPFRRTAGLWDLVVEVSVVDPRRAAGAFGGIVSYAFHGVQASSVIDNWAFVEYPWNHVDNWSLCHALIHEPIAGVRKMFSELREPPPPQGPL